MKRPLIHELTPMPDVLEALQSFSTWPTPLLLESARRLPGLGRYSFLTADPVHFECRQTARWREDPFAALRGVWDAHRCQTVAGLPPFQGGVAGLLGYELGQAWERVPPAGRDEFAFPDLAAGVYDWVLAWDLELGRCWLICHDLAGAGSARRRQAQVLQQLRTEAPADRLAANPSAWRLELAELEAHAQLAALPGLHSNFTHREYLQAVQRVIEYIAAGDIFQANLSQRLLFPQQSTPLELYRRLRLRNAAPFAGFLQHDDWSVLSASPERFVRIETGLDGGEVETRPIKGTRRRGVGPEADLFTRDELRQSAKDRAENVMIVDLLRNDLSRVCRPGSVRVVDLCRVETYETVQHLVSEIRGTLQPGATGWELLAAAFPGGSITGAPKIRSMEIIAELEPTVRGPYCGSLFYLGFDGQMDSNILIRTLAIRRGWIQCGVGGGIVAQSTPAAEYDETLDKAEGMLRALREEIETTRRP